MDLIRNMLNGASELLSEGKSIVEWFNPKSCLHRGAFKIYCQTGSWPEGFVPENVTLTPGFRTALVKKLNEAFPRDVEKPLPEWAQKGIRDAVATMEQNPEEMDLAKALDIVYEYTPDLQQWTAVKEDVALVLEKYGIMEGKLPSKDDNEAKIVQKLTEAGIKENEVRDIWVVIRPGKQSTMEDVVAKSSPRRLMIMARGGLDPKDLIGVYDNEVEARKKGSSLLGAGVHEKKVNEAPADAVIEPEAGAGFKDPGFTGKKEPGPGEKEEENPVGDLEVDDEHEAVEADFDKIYLGQDDTTHFYVIAKKDEEGGTEDLQVTDQEGKKLFSATENDIDIHDVGKFILAALNDDKVKVRELDREVVIQYLVPEKEEEIAPEEEEEEDEGGLEGEETPSKGENAEIENPDQERPMESKVRGQSGKVNEIFGLGGRNYFVPSSVDGVRGDSSRIQVALQKAVKNGLIKSFKASHAGFSILGVKDPSAVNRLLPAGISMMRESKKIKKESELVETMMMKDGKGNTFSLQVIDEGGKDVVIQINNREFRFKPDFVALYEMDSGKLTEKGLQDLAAELISHLREDEYAEVVGSGIQESSEDEEDHCPKCRWIGDHADKLQYSQAKKYSSAKEAMGPTATPHIQDGYWVNKESGLKIKVVDSSEDLLTVKSDSGKTWKTTLKELLANYDHAAEGSEVHEDLDPSVTKEVGEDTLLQRAQQLRAKKDRSPDDDATLQQLESELKARGQKEKSVEGKIPDKDDSDAKIIQKLTERIAPRVGDTVQIKDKEGNTTIIPHGVVTDVDYTEPEHTLAVQIERGDDWFDSSDYTIRILESKVNEGDLDDNYPPDLDDEIDRGGLATKAGKKPKDFSKEQLAAGTKVEMEHTNNPSKAQQIAMDHLTEDPQYYTKLKNMESKVNEKEISGSEIFQKMLQKQKEAGKPRDERKAAEAALTLLSGGEFDSVEGSDRETYIDHALEKWSGQNIKTSESKMNEGEYSDMALQGNTKKVFKVDFVLDNGEKRSTRVMAIDKTEAEKMLKGQKGVKSITGITPVAGTKKESKNMKTDKKVDEMSRYSRSAQTDEQERAIGELESTLSGLGKRVVGGTTIGKSPQTVILDLKHQGSEIRVESDGEVKINGRIVDPSDESEVSDAVSGKMTAEDLPSWAQEALQGVIDNSNDATNNEVVAEIQSNAPEGQWNDEIAAKVKRAVRQAGFESPWYDESKVKESKKVNEDSAGSEYHKKLWSFLNSPWQEDNEIALVEMVSQYRGDFKVNKPGPIQDYLRRLVQENNIMGSQGFSDEFMNQLQDLMGTNPSKPSIKIKRVVPEEPPTESKASKKNESKINDRKHLQENSPTDLASKLKSIRPSEYDSKAFRVWSKSPTPENLSALHTDYVRWYEKNADEFYGEAAGELDEFMYTLEELVGDAGKTNPNGPSEEEEPSEPEMEESKAGKKNESKINEDEKGDDDLVAIAEITGDYSSQGMKWPEDVVKSHVDSLVSKFGQDRAVQLMADSIASSEGWTLEDIQKLAKMFKTSARNLIPEKGTEDESSESENEPPEPEMEESIQTARRLLGLKEKAEEDEPVKVGDLVQIVDANTYRVEVEEATVKAIDEKKGIEITGSTIPVSQRWYSKPYWFVSKL